MKNCPEILIDLSAYLDGELSSEDAQILQNHLAKCCNCRTKMESFRTDKESLTKSFDAFLPNPDFVPRLMETTGEKFTDQKNIQEKTFWLKITHWQTVRFPAAVAATIALCLVLYFFIAAGHHKERVEIGFIDQIAGNLQIRDKHRSSSLEVGAIIYEGMQLSTDHRSKASLTMLDGTQIKLNHSTGLSFKTKEKGRSLVLAEGEIWTSVSPAELPFTIETSLGIITVTGTELNIKISGDEKVLAVALLEGTAACTTPRGTTNMTSGRLLEIRNNRETIIHNENPDDLTDWTMFRQGPNQTGYVNTVLELPLEIKWIYPLSFSEQFEGGVAITRRDEVDFINIGAFGNPLARSPLYALEILKNNCRLRWKKHLGNIWTWPAVSRELIIVPTTEDKGTLYALDENTGLIKWSYEVKNYIKTSPLVLNELVYFADGDGFIYALKLMNGDLVWKQLLGEGISLSSPTAGTNDTLFISALNGVLYALDGRSGQVQWSRPTDGRIFTAPVIHDQTLFVHSEDEWPAVSGTLYAINISNGKINWQHKLPHTACGSATIAQGLVFVSCGDGGIYAFDAESGKIKWHFNQPLFSSSPVATKNLLLALESGETPGLYALSLTSGEVKFKQVMLSGTSEITLIDRIIYALTKDGKFYALDKKPLPAEEQKEMMTRRLEELLAETSEKRRATYELARLDDKFVVRLSGRVFKNEFQRLGLDGGLIRAERYFIETQEGAYELVGSDFPGMRIDECLNKWIGQEVIVRGGLIKGPEPEMPRLREEEIQWNQERPYPKLVYLEIKTP